MQRFSLIILFIYAFLELSGQNRGKDANRIIFSDSIDQYLPMYQYQKPTWKGQPEVYEVVKHIELISLPKSATQFKSSITEALDEILDAKPEKVVVKLEKPGYRIQLYVGRDRDEANRIKGICLNMKIDEITYVMYDRPNYRVKVGDFLTREDARELYRTLKKRFPDAMIVPDLVTVVKEATPDELLLLRRKEAEEKLRRERVR